MSGELHQMGVAELATALRERKVSAVEAAQHHLGRMRTAPGPGRLRGRRRRPDAGPGPRRRRADRRRQCAGARRRADRAQGHLRHRRPPDHRRLPHPGRLPLALRCHRRAQARRSRRRDARQAELRRVRDGLGQRERRRARRRLRQRRAGAQPLGSRRAFPAVRRAAAPQPSPRAWRRRRPAPTRAARSASRRPSAA